MSRKPPGRATRQILSGSDLAPTPLRVDDRTNAVEPPSLAFWYLSALALLIILAAVVWAIGGMGPASPFLLLLAVGMIASWLVI